jgi:anti-sigma28 factor (negative regulator of flagellin synthesis)
MRISALSESFNAEFRKVDATKKADKVVKQKLSPVDSSQVSSGARQMNEAKASNDIVFAQISSQPDVRPEKVAEVQEKIRNGFYDTEELASKLADKMIDDLGLRKLLS